MCSPVRIAPLYTLATCKKGAHCLRLIVNANECFDAIDYGRGDVVNVIADGQVRQQRHHNNVRADQGACQGQLACQRHG